MPMEFNFCSFGDFWEIFLRKKAKIFGFLVIFGQNFDFWVWQDFGPGDDFWTPGGQKVIILRGFWRSWEGPEGVLKGSKTGLDLK